MADTLASSNSSKQNKSSQDSVTLSPTQTSIIYWLAGAVPIAKALTPPATYWGIVRKKAFKNLPEATRAARIYQNVISDVSRQSMTCTFQLASYFIAGDLIKIGLQKYFDHKKEKAIQAGNNYTDQQKKKDDTKKQMTLQVSSLIIQVIATIVSRPFGGTDLQKLLDQEDFPQKEPKGSWIGRKVENYIKNNLRRPDNGHLMPKKAAWVATAAITLYLGGLMGVLYGFSQFMQNTFGSKNNKNDTAPSTHNTHNPSLQKQSPLSKPFSPLALNPNNANSNPIAYGNSPNLPSFSGYPYKKTSLAPY